MGIGIARESPPLLEQIIANFSGDQTAVVVQPCQAKNSEDLAARLRSCTEMLVREAQQGQWLEPNTLYLCPPERWVEVAESKLQVRLPSELDGADGLPVDRLLLSLAREYGSAAMGCIIGDLGSDGAAGSFHILREGGIVLDGTNAHEDGLVKVHNGRNLRASRWAFADIARHLDYYREAGIIEPGAGDREPAACGGRDEARLLLASIVESTEDAVFSGSLSTGTIQSWNPGAEQLFGYSQAEAIGMPIQCLFPPERAVEKDEILDEITKGRSIRQLETVRLKKTGERVDVSLTVTPMVNEAGQVAGASVIARDISTTKRIQQDLQRSNWKLKQINEELKEFTYVASHDLREPLRTIRSFCELLRDAYHGKLDDQADRWIAFMVDGAERMHRMIDDLLDYSRIDSRQLVRELTDFNNLMRAVIGDLTQAITEASAVVTCDQLPVLPVDPTQVHQLLLNLVGNAIKYRGDAAPTVHVTARQLSGTWEFSVSDNGIGIDREHFERIFGLFKRLNSRQKYAGTGIGLTVCRKIVQRHGGRIWVTSTGTGSTFHFTIPDSSTAAK